MGSNNEKMVKHLVTHTLQGVGGADTWWGDDPQRPGQAGWEAQDIQRYETPSAHQGICITRYSRLWNAFSSPRYLYQKEAKTWLKFMYDSIKQIKTIEQIIDSWKVYKLFYLLKESDEI